MLKSYLKIALRSFLKLRAYSIANLIGLVIGLSSVFVVSAYIKYELSFDRYYSNSNRIYRLVGSYDKAGEIEQMVRLPESIGYVIQKELPGIEATTCFTKDKDEFLVNNQPIKISYLTADSLFFSVFNVPLIYGKAVYVLKNNNNVVISKSMANKLFPKQNALGRQLLQKGDKGRIITYTVTGVMQDIPANTHFSCDMVIGVNNHNKVIDLMAYREATSYILLNPATDASELESSADGLVKKYHLPFQITLQPVTDIHLHSAIQDEYFNNGSIQYVYIFSIATIIILVIACINYINFNTTASLQRLKEIGIRKVFGAQINMLSFQFVFESVLFFFLTIPFALVLAVLVWPLFAQTLQVQVSALYLLSPGFILLLAGITLITGVLAGSYAAFFVARLRPAYILKDWKSSVATNVKLRRMLVVLQFCISMALVISTVIIRKQLYLLNNMNVGYNKENLIVLPDQLFNHQALAFKSELEKRPEINGVSISSWNVGDSYGGYSMMPDPTDTTKFLEASIISADADFFKTLQLKMIAGRSFLKDNPADAAKFDTMLLDNNATGRRMSPDEIMNLVSREPIIISEPMVNILHLKQPVIGTVLKYRVLYGTVIGEISNFIGTSLTRKTLPVIIKYDRDPRNGYTYLKVSGKNIRSTIEYIQTTWNKFFPTSSFDFSFVDERLQNQFSSQERMAAIFTIFSSLAIIISLAGLIGLLALTIHQKIKEISVRRVLGASLLNILGLFAKSYLPIIFLASLIATPVTWWIMYNWLQDFTYHIKLDAWLFIEIIIGCLLLVCTGIALQITRLSKIKPAKTLRME